MGLIIECPQCKKRNSSKATQCKCGLNIKKASGKSYWIEYYINGKRKRERVGPSKAAADQRLREVLTARTEERHIFKDLAAKATLRQLCDWYLVLPEVMAKRSYRRDKEFIHHLLRHLGGDTKIKDLTIGRVESYQSQRLSEPSPRHLGEKIRPATVNKEVVCLKTILNRAVRHGKLNANPIAQVKKLPENNVRMKVLSQDDFEGLLAACPDHLRPIVLMAYYTGMRRSEIVYLIWDEVDLEKGFIRLPPDRPKTKVARSIPLHPCIRAMLIQQPRGLHTDRVFLRNGIPFDEIKRSFGTACRKAGLRILLFMT